jgi:hypothetical protein
MNKNKGPPSLSPKDFYQLKGNSNLLVKCLLFILIVNINIVTPQIQIKEPLIGNKDQLI